MKKVFFFGVAVLIALAKPVFAQAPPAVSLVVSPPTFELSSAPGKIVTNVIKVTNPSSQTLDVKVVLKDFIASGEEGGVDLTDIDTETDTTYSLSKWISVEPAAAAILPKATANFTYTITTPRDAEPGGHFGGILFSVGGGDVSGSGASVTTEVGSLVLLNLSGKTKEDAKLVSFEPIKRLNEYGPIELEYRVQNKGNVHIKPVGKVVIKDMLGRIAYENSVDPKNALPASVRKNIFKWDTKWLFGKYRAQISLNYGAESKLLYSETQFWVIPYKIVIAVVAVVGLFIIYISRNGKRIKKAIRLIAGKD